MQSSCGVVFTESVFLRFSRFRLRDDNFFHLDRLRPCIAFYYAHTPDGVVFDIFVEVADLFSLLCEDSLVFLGLLGTGGVVGAEVLKPVDIHIALIDEHIGDFALIVGEVISLYLVVVGGEQLDNFCLAQPPIDSGYPAV